MDNEKVREEKFTYEDYIKLCVAYDIWKICAISPDHGNAVMDLIGEEAYQKVMDLVRQRDKFVNRLVNKWVDDYYMKKEDNNGDNK